jgi:uncharacterized protein DUF3363
VPLRDSCFGREVRDALALRRQWLIEQELARAEQDQTIYRANMLAILRRRELTRAVPTLTATLTTLAFDESSLQWFEVKT